MPRQKLKNQALKWFMPIERRKYRPVHWYWHSHQRSTQNILILCHRIHSKIKWWLLLISCSLWIDHCMMMHTCVGPQLGKNLKHGGASMQQCHAQFVYVLRLQYPSIGLLELSYPSKKCQHPPLPPKKDEKYILVFERNEWNGGRQISRLLVLKSLIKYKYE